MSNIDTIGFGEYLKVFHETYIEGVERFVEPDWHGFLDRYPRLPSRIKGYVSTTFGVAFEYIEEGAGVEVTHSSRRVEFMLLNAPASVRRLPAMMKIAGPGSGIATLSIEGALPFWLESPEATVTLDRVGFRALGWNRDVEYAEVFGDRSRELWTPAKAVRRATDEILAAVTDINDMRREHVKLSEFLDREKERTVLIAGDYGPEGSKRLSAIRKGVRELGFLPRILTDVPDMPDYDLTEKFVALGQLARFVIFDDSSAAGYLREFQVAAAQGWIVVVLRREGSHSSFVTRGEELKSRVLREWTYTDDSLLGVLYQAVEWAEKLVSELREGRQEAYPWRAPDQSETDA